MVWFTTGQGRKETFLEVVAEKTNTREETKGNRFGPKHLWVKRNPGLTSLQWRACSSVSVRQASFLGMDSFPLSKNNEVPENGYRLRFQELSVYILQTEL